MANYRVIGKPVERVDGPEMLTGQAVYGPDVKLPGMLWGKILRSPIPHGKVLSVDLEKAKKHPGVKSVIAAKDVPARRYGYAVEDEHIFAIDKVRFVGQPVAAVGAVVDRRRVRGIARRLYCRRGDARRRALGA